MDYTLDDMRTAMQELRQRLYSGEILDSLGTEIGRILDQIDYDEPTPIEQIENDQIAMMAEKMATWQTTMNEGTEKVQLSDTDVLDLLRNLRQLEPATHRQTVFFVLTDLLQQGNLTQQQLILMTRYLLQDSVLFGHILEQENDGIFMRSAAVFILAMLNYANRSQSADLFGDQLRNTMIEQIVLYTALERDPRGFVGDRGWAHAFMHIGNIIDDLSLDPAVSRADKILMLTVLLERVKRLDGPLVMGELRRIAGYITRLVNMHEIYASYFLKQLKQWRQELTRNIQPTQEGDWHRFYNQIRLLQSLLLRGENLPDEIFEYLNEARNFII